MSEARAGFQPVVSVGPDDDAASMAERFPWYVPEIRMSQTTSSTVEVLRA